MLSSNYSKSLNVLPLALEGKQMQPSTGTIKLPGNGEYQKKIKMHEKQVLAKNSNVHYKCFLEALRLVCCLWKEHDCVLSWLSFGEEKEGCCARCRCPSGQGWALCIRAHSQKLAFLAL